MSWSAMDARARGRVAAPRQGAHDDALDLGQALEAGDDTRAIAPSGPNGEIDERAIVAGFRGEELTPQGVEVRVLGPRGLGEELKALARAGLDERRDEQPIDERRHADVARQAVGRATQVGRVGVDRRRAERHVSRSQKGDDALKVIDLFAREVRQVPDELRIREMARGE